MNPGFDSVRRQRRVLIVDDERQNRQLLEVMLKPEGYLLSVAASGEEALAMVARDSPDVILLDVMMPGLDGYAVAKAIKAQRDTKDIPIIMVTALDDRDARIQGLRAGAEEFISKPFDRVELCVRVRNLSRLKGSGDAKYRHRLEDEVDSRTATLVIRAKTLEEEAAVLAAQAALLDLTQDAIVVRDAHDRILFWSRGAEALYGWAAEEALGKNLQELVGSVCSEPAEQIEASLLSEGRWEGELVQYTRRGSRLIVASRCAVQREAGGVPVRILSISHDITARKRTEAERLVLTERLSLATAVAKVGVWEWHLASDTLTWDATMRDIYDCQPLTPMPYASWADAVCPEDLPATEAALQQAIAERGQGAIEFRIRRPDGSLRHIAGVHRAVADEGALASRVIGVNMDVTDQKLAEEALEQSCQNQILFKNEFLSHVSHELRSPLTAIKQFTSILLSGSAGKLNREQRDYQQIVFKNIQQLQAMVDDLLEVTRLETGKLTIELASVSGAAAATDTVKTLQGAASAKGVAVSCQIAPDLPQVFADDTRLRQILIILLDNAIKFTDSGGSAAIRVRRSPHDAHLVSFEVSDTGCGITPERAARIFERLYQVPDHIQSSRKGLGLGLYICRELVTRQGGEVAVKSELNRGTTFTVTLPMCSHDSALGPGLKNPEWPSPHGLLARTATHGRDGWPSKGSPES